MQRDESDATHAEHNPSGGDNVRAKPAEDVSEDLFGGLTLSKADEGNSLI